MSEVVITKEMIDHHIAFTKAEYDVDLTEEQATAELNKLKDIGCLIYPDCRACPKYSSGKCPL